MKTNLPCNKKLVLAALLGGACLMSVPAFAQAPSDRPTMGRQEAVSDDAREFLAFAAESGMREAAICQTVVGRLPANSEVRELAESLMKGRSTIDSRIQDLAARYGVSLPAVDRDLVRDWVNKDVEDLSEDYLNQMIDDHAEAIDRFEEATELDDAEIAKFARENLPTLREHLQEVRVLKATRG